MNRKKLGLLGTIGGPILLMALASCTSTSSLSRYTFSQEECDKLESVPDTCLVDTLDILGTIFPKNYTFNSDSGVKGPYSTWTPMKSDVMRAEAILKRRVIYDYRCIDSSYTRYYRQYAGHGDYRNIVLIHGILMSQEFMVCGHKSFWLNIYETGCSIFDAAVDITLGTCEITFPYAVQEETPKPPQQAPPPPEPDPPLVKKKKARRY